MVKTTIRWRPDEWQRLLDEALHGGEDVPTMLRRWVRERYKLGEPVDRKRGRPRKGEG